MDLSGNIPTECLKLEMKRIDKGDKKKQKKRPKKKAKLCPQGGQKSSAQCQNLKKSVYNVAKYFRVLESKIDTLKELMKADYTHVKL